MIRIHVASANSSIAKTRNRPASGAGAGSAGSDLAGLGGRGRSAVSRSIWRCVLAMRAASIRSLSSSKVSRPATKCSRSWVMARSRSASPILRS